MQSVWWGLGAAALQLVSAHGTQGTAFGLVSIDNFGGFFKLFTCAATAVCIVFVMLDRRERRHRIGEYYFLLLSAAIGIFFMVGTYNLLLLVLGLELASLSSYSLAGFHKGEKRSAEAAMKYVVFGGLSAGVMVFGISLLYAVTGTLDMRVMSGALAIDPVGEGVARSLAVALEQSPGMVALAMILILGGFSYKISAAPFHFWAPDVYEGSPTPVTTFLAVASKAGGFGALMRFFGVLFVAPNVGELIAAYRNEIGMVLALVAAATMTLGNLAALRQTSLKRMLAYSSVAHAGYVLVGIAAMNQAGMEASLFYLAAYYFMNLARIRDGPAVLQSQARPVASRSNAFMGAHGSVMASVACTGVWHGGVFLVSLTWNCLLRSMASRFQVEDAIRCPWIRQKSTCNWAGWRFVWDSESVISREIPDRSSDQVVP